MSTGELGGRVVLITGSSRGIGAGAARVAHREGARVILHGRSVSPRLEALAAELGASYITCDVADGEAVRAAVSELLQRESMIHALINCAGDVHPKPWLESTDEDWSTEFQVNMLGTVHFCRAVAPVMLEGGYGRIVNVSSIRGEAELASARAMGYSASKAAVNSFTVALAKELAPVVAVNAVGPGFIHTDLSDTWNETVWNQARSALVGRVGEPEDIGEVLAFLASDRAKFITGQIVVVDGGYSVAGK